MKKLVIFCLSILTLTYSSALVVNAASTGTFTVSVGSWGGVKYSPEMSYSSDYTYAINNVTSVSGGDKYDIKLFTYYGGLWISTGGKQTIPASKKSYKVEFVPEDLYLCRPGYDYTVLCTGDNTSSTKCVKANKKYKLEYYNGSLIGGTVKITGSLSASN